MAEVRIPIKWGDNEIIWNDNPYTWNDVALVEEVVDEVQEEAQRRGGMVDIPYFETKIKRND
jgi:hypothetical protein